MKKTMNASWNHRQNIREIVRHGLFRSGSFGLLGVARRHKGYVTNRLSGDDRQESFAQA